MPTYEYACDACGHRFEAFQSIMAKPIVKCPQCGKRKVKRLISGGAGFIFKGSGFYATDYRSESYKSAAKADSGKTEAPAAAASGGKGDAPAAPAAAPAKTDPKPDPKPAAKPKK